VARPILYHIEISHFNEKARWALEYKRVSHVRRAPPPLMHMLWAIALTGKPTFPILKLDGEAISDSTRIIEALEVRFPEPPLYPVDQSERRRALELEDFFDEELGPYIRRWAFHEALEVLEPGEFVLRALGNAPPLVKRVMSASGQVGGRLVRLRYGADPEGAEEARQKTEAAFERLEREIQPSGYLVGDGFTVADLTAAALLFPLVKPPEAPPGFSPLPPSLERFRDEMSTRRGFEWVLEMYRRHRGIPAGPAHSRERVPVPD
jgi:glutathione S-transferase